MHYRTLYIDKFSKKKYFLANLVNLAVKTLSNNSKQFVHTVDSVAFTDLYKSSFTLSNTNEGRLN